MPNQSDLKVSLITTERNEAESIKDFIESVLAQSKQPDEIIIADGGSSDGTIEIIESYMKTGAPIKLVQAPGNRAIGRNAATKAATHEIIACTDVGSRLDKNWLLNITAPFKAATVMAVAGNFKAAPESSFERISSALMLQGNDQINLETWLPSSRSIAYRKVAWAQVGGYPEHTNFNEDTPFDIALRDAGYQFADGLKAVVYWRPRPNLRQFYQQYYYYAVGDGIDSINRGGMIRLTVIYGLTLVLVIGLAVLQTWLALLPLVFWLLFVLRRIYGGWKQILTPLSIVLMPILMITYDLSQLAGYWYGVLYKKRLRGSDRLVR